MPPGRAFTNCTPFLRIEILTLVASRLAILKFYINPEICNSFLFHKIGFIQVRRNRLTTHSSPVYLSWYQKLYILRLTLSNKETDFPSYHSLSSKKQMNLKMLTYVYFVSQRNYFRRQYCILVNRVLWNHTASVHIPGCQFQQFYPRQVFLNFYELHFLICKVGS